MTQGAGPAAQHEDTRGSTAETFRHEALLYASEREFLDGTLAFLREAVDSGEPILVAVGAERIALLCDALGEDAERVEWVNMTQLGTNPARIIPAWQAFIDAHAEREGGYWGIGEPAWPGRSEAEIAECHRHEALLNLAFAETAGFRLLCPYDVRGLDPVVVAAAHCTHPIVVDTDGARPSECYVSLEVVAQPFAEPLAEPAAVEVQFAYDADALGAVRQAVALHAASAGLPAGRREDLVLAVNEVATNSVRHAAGRGVLRIWQEREALVYELRDDGRIGEPLAGRIRPAASSAGGYGLWLVNQLCDLVQVRAMPEGNVVRLHMRRDA